MQVAFFCRNPVIMCYSSTETRALLGKRIFFHFIADTLYSNSLALLIAINSKGRYWFLEKSLHKKKPGPQGRNAHLQTVYNDLLKQCQITHQCQIEQKFRDYFV